MVPTICFSSGGGRSLGLPEPCAGSCRAPRTIRGYGVIWLSPGSNLIVRSFGTR